MEDVSQGEKHRRRVVNISAYACPRHRGEACRETLSLRSDEAQRRAHVVAEGMEALRFPTMLRCSVDETYLRRLIGNRVVFPSNSDALENEVCSPSREKFTLIGLVEQHLDAWVRGWKQRHSFRWGLVKLREVFYHEVIDAIPELFGLIAELLGFA